MSIRSGRVEDRSVLGPWSCPWRLWNELSCCICEMGLPGPASLKGTMPSGGKANGLEDVGPARCRPPPPPRACQCW